MEKYYRFTWVTKCSNETLRNYISKTFNDKTVAEIMFHKICFKKNTERGLLFTVEKLNEKEKKYEIVESYYK